MLPLSALSEFETVDKLGNNCEEEEKVLILS